MFLTPSCEFGCRPRGDSCSTAPVPEADPIDELLAICASEPIHAPGAVQPHGALLVLDGDGVVRSVSANLDAVAGRPAGEVLGRTLAEGLGPAWADALAGTAEGLVATVEVGGEAFECVAAEHDGVVLLEVERGPGDALADASRLFPMLDAFHGATSIDELLGGAVATVAQLTGFDRVMCYRFDPDWNGEVVAEVVGPGVAPFDGLRFPASDIPPQARAQYERTPLRLIPDAAAEPSPLLVEDAAWADLDLSDVSVRAVSPVHLRYLRNMGVRSSMSVSLTVDGRLWGLIACHHSSGVVRPSHRVRNAVRLAARTTSTVLAVLLSQAASEHKVVLLHRLARLAGALRDDEARAPLDVLSDHAAEAMALVDATGLVLTGERSRHVAGTVAPDDVVAGLVARARTAGGALVDDHLGAEDGGPAGALVVPVVGTADQWLVWFRPETAETVRWAGDPAKRADEATGRLEPRASFAAYVEEVRGRAAPWSDDEVSVAVDLASRVGEADRLRARLEAELAGQLQRALMLEGFPAVRGVAGAARYVPVSGSPLGGDWYDVFFLPSGRSIVAVGDVAGHGIEVASTMAQLRHALRAYLIRVPSFEDALGRLNDLLLTLLPADMATVVLAEVDGTEGTVRLANAGHLPAVVASPHGSRLVEARGPALGWENQLPHDAVEVPLAPGERLVLYSDGLVERRGQSLDDGLDALLVAAGATVHLGVDEQADALLEHFTAGADADDDITVVVVELVEDKARVAERGLEGVAP